LSNKIALNIGEQAGQKHLFSPIRPRKTQINLLNFTARLYYFITIPHKTRTLVLFKEAQPLKQRLATKQKPDVSDQSLFKEAAV
jgi:hypothetical protein